MDSTTIAVIVCFSGVAIIITLVVIIFMCLSRKLEIKYLDALKDNEKLLLETMDRDTVLERMVKGGRVLQYITILGAFTAVFFLAVLGHISAEIAGTIIGMIITAVIGAEAGARVPGVNGKTYNESEQQRRGNTEKLESK